MCRKVDFFSIFPLFIEMDICGINKSKAEEKDFKDFQGLVESRVLKLLQNIQRFYKKEIEEGSFKIVPFPKMFKKKYISRYLVTANTLSAAVSFSESTSSQKPKSTWGELSRNGAR